MRDKYHSRLWKAPAVATLCLLTLSGCWEYYAINVGLNIAQIVIPPAYDAAKDVYSSLTAKTVSLPSPTSSWSQGMSNTTVCQSATKNNASVWDYNASYDTYVAEAQNRNLTLIDCARILGYATPTATAVSYTVELDQVPPSISLTSATIVESDTYLLSGEVRDTSEVASLRVDGKTIPLARDGSFSVPYYVPPAGLVIEIAAIDVWSNKGTKTVKIRRIKTLKPEKVQFAALNPLRARGRSNPNAYALIIGVENYQNAPMAKFADRDAQVFSDYARRALGIRAENIKLLLNKHATRTSIQKALKLWLPAVSKNRKSDIFLFVAGHGLASRDRRGRYILPYDADVDLLDDTSLKLEDIIVSVSKARPRSATIFLDTCFSGGTRTNETLVSDARGIWVAAKSRNLPRNFTVISAAGNDQISTHLPEAKHGLFSYFLMKGLEGDADINSDGSITTGEIHHYLEENVPGQAIRLGRRQNPQIAGEYDRVLTEN